MPPPIFNPWAIALALGIGIVTATYLYLTSPAGYTLEDLVPAFPPTKKDKEKPGSHKENKNFGFIKGNKNHEANKDTESGDSDDKHAPRGTEPNSTDDKHAGVKSEFDMDADISPTFPMDIKSPQSVSVIESQLSRIDQQIHSLSNLRNDLELQLNQIQVTYHVANDTASEGMSSSLDSTKLLTYSHDQVLNHIHANALDVKHETVTGFSDTGNRNEMDQFALQAHLPLSNSDSTDVSSASGDGSGVRHPLQTDLKRVIPVDQQSDSDYSFISSGSGEAR